MKYSKIFIILNLIWAFAYNIFIMPVAAGAFIAYGFTVSPIIASSAMSGSSLFVVIFSNFLRCVTFDPSNQDKWKSIKTEKLVD